LAEYANIPKFSITFL